MMRISNNQISAIKDKVILGTNMAGVSALVFAKRIWGAGSQTVFVKIIT